MSDRLVLHRLARFANWNAEGRDDAAAGAHEIGAWSVCSDAAPAHARAFYQEKERVSQELRLRGAGSLTEIRQAFALTHLKFLNHAKTGMALLGQFDRGLGDGFDSPPSNALAVEKVLRAVEDAVAGLPDPGNLYVRVRIRFFFVHG